jgi:hypothetical protein
MGFLDIAIILRILLGFFQVFYAIFRDFLGLGILGFSKILGFFQRFFGIFDEVYEDFQSNLPLEIYIIFPSIYINTAA